MNFWQKLKKPIFILAPMDAVTETVFRQIVTSVGKPDVLFTEFVPVDGLLSKGRDRVMLHLKFDKIERPIIAQIWGSKPENFYKAAKILVDLGFDGIDINMGCPVSNIITNGSCSALIKNPEKAKEIIEATKKGAGTLPVSVKTRIGFDSIDTEDWVRTLLQTDIAALTLHLRTAKEMSKVPAHWEEIEKAVNLRNEMDVKTLIIGNGDIKSLREAKEKCIKYGIDGVMIGRGIFENVWVFNENIDIKKVTPRERADLLIKHLELYQKTYGDGKHFELTKKFVKCYINNFEGAFEIRDTLMRTSSLEQLISSTKKLSFLDNVNTPSPIIG